MFKDIDISQLTSPSWLEDRDRQYTQSGRRRTRAVVPAAKPNWAKDRNKYMAWYREQNSAVILQQQRERYRENRDHILAKRRESYAKRVAAAKAAA
jgi:hypothetical protein